MGLYLRGCKLIFLSFNDAHFCDKAPESRLDEDYGTTLLDKLGQIAKVSDRVGARALLNAGDLFHIKEPSRNSHRQNLRLMEVFQKFPQVLSIAGNHDLTGDRLDSLEKQPLGSLFGAGVTKHIHLTPSVFEEDGLKVKVVGLSFVQDVAEFAGHPSFSAGESERVIGVFHCFAAKARGDMYGEAIHSYEDFIKWFPDVSVFVFGHFHSCGGIDEYNGRWFVSTGSLSRGSLHLDNLLRQVMCGFIDVKREGIKCRGVALKVRPSEEVLSVKVHEEQKAERARIEAFVGMLQEVKAAGGSAGTIRSYLDTQEIPARVRTKALEILERCGLSTGNE